MILFFALLRQGSQFHSYQKNINDSNANQNADNNLNFLTNAVNSFI